MKSETLENFFISQTKFNIIEHQSRPYGFTTVHVWYKNTLVGSELIFGSIARDIPALNCYIFRLMREKFIKAILGSTVC